ncbi:MAG: calcium-binding protein, partial [Rhizobiales bacterium]|nr:calcium-binding protein [Hyphomicrobiales bacterium]
EYVYGSEFADTITGTDAVNRLVGGGGNDTLDGAGGNDILLGGLGADTLIGGVGTQDAASYQDATSGVALSLTGGGTGGEATGDTFSGIEYVYGSDFSDSITGDAAVNRLVGGIGNDSLSGGDGNDVLIGGLEADTLIGGAGTQDAASYQYAEEGVNLSLATGGIGGEAVGDTFSGVEFVYGSAYGDTIAGDGSVNRLVGGAGNDS